MKLKVYLCLSVYEQYIIHIFKERPQIQSLRAGKANTYSMSFFLLLSLLVLQKTLLYSTSLYKKVTCDNFPFLKPLYKCGFLSINKQEIRKCWDYVLQFHPR